MTENQSTHTHAPHALYRFYDAAGALLYVGITLNPTARWKQHSKDKPWWGDVADIKLEHHPDRPSVLNAERTAIITERPRHNVVHNRGPATTTLAKPRPRRSHVQCANAHGWVEPGPGGALVCCDCGHRLYSCCPGCEPRRPQLQDPMWTAAYDTTYGLFAEDMPDQCHDACIPTGHGIDHIYYPHLWRDGIATYRCDKGHLWTCTWGHAHSGVELENAGVNQAARRTA